MSELTGLELNKKIAEIDGLTDCMFKHWTLIYNSDGSDSHYEHYNPLSDWNITGPLMVKHEISHYATLGNAFKQYRAFYEYITEDDEIERFTVMHKDLQRAILLAIVAKFEAVK